MTRVDDYRAALRANDDWDSLLRAECRLPGPRANLELLEAAVLEGDAARFRHWRELPATGQASDEFLLICGVTGLGRLLAAGDRAPLAELRRYAGDSRWRVREAVAIALQHWGDADVGALLEEMGRWSAGDAFVQRAVVAAICEPRLLRTPDAARWAMRLLDRITTSYRALSAADRRTEGPVALRKALSYGWSVAVAALPDEGRPLLDCWAADSDPGIQRIMRENLGKARLRPRH